MNLKKRCIGWLLIAAMLLPITACTADHSAAQNMQVVATLFPQYDFARRIAGDKASVALLLPPGVESHSFDPTPSQIVAIQKADVFLYTGEFMEPWSGALIVSLPDKETIVDVSKGIALLTGEDEHEHSGVDPHFWTDIANAQIMVQTILEAFCEKDPQNEATYCQNAQILQDELAHLDEEFSNVIREAPKKTMVFGGRFAARYFVAHYGLDALCAYSGCTEETEPSAWAIVDIVDEMQRQDLHAVFYEELSDPKVARAIAEQTNAKLLLFHSCHNVSKDDFDAGISYVDLMKQNLANLREGLK